MECLTSVRLHLSLSWSSEDEGLSGVSWRESPRPEPGPPRSSPTDDRFSANEKIKRVSATCQPLGPNAN